MFSILAQSMLTATRSDVPEEPHRLPSQSSTAAPCSTQPTDKVASKRAAG